MEDDSNVEIGKKGSACLVYLHWNFQYCRDFAHSLPFDPKEKELER